jgi:hypothetical protein
MRILKYVTWFLLLIIVVVAVFRSKPTSAPVKPLSILNGKVKMLVSQMEARGFHLGSRGKTAACKVNGALPDSACTPGAVFASATVAEVCTAGYAKTVRAVSAKIKKQVYAEYGFAYPQAAGAFEADHQIPLELGGSNDMANLWPEAAMPVPGFREKDLVENYLHEEVCAGSINLKSAQELIADNWLQVYNGLSAEEIAALKAGFANWSSK